MKVDNEQYAYSLDMHESVIIAPTGIWGGMSFERLAAFLEAHGETTPTEHITHFRIEDGYISYRVEHKE